MMAPKAKKSPVRAVCTTQLMEHKILVAPAGTILEARGQWRLCSDLETEAGSQQAKGGSGPAQDTE